MAECLTFIADIEEFLRCEAECACKQHGRELLDHAIVSLDHAVESVARVGKPVLDTGQLGLELLESAIRLEVRLGLCQSEQLPHRSAE